MIFLISSLLLHFPSTSYLFMLPGKNPARLSNHKFFLLERTVDFNTSPLFCRWGRYAQQRQITCPRFQRELLAEGRPDPRPFAFLSSAICAVVWFRKVCVLSVQFEPLTQRSKDQDCAPSVLDIRLTKMT